MLNRPKTTKPKKKLKPAKIKALFKKMNGTSGLEVAFASLLDKLGVNYVQHFVFKKREYDFFLPDYKILIETHGCFFHCCKKDGYLPKYPFQKRNVRNDQHKVKLVKATPGYKLIVFWEHEMASSSTVVQKLKEHLNLGHIVL